MWCKIKFLKGDLKNTDAVERAVKNIDGIFHLGAMIAVPYSIEDPREFVETNVLGTLNILNAAKRNNLEKIIITSTSEVYGTAEYTPIDEKHPLQAQSPYSASKIGAEKIYIPLHNQLSEEFLLDLQEKKMNSSISCCTRMVLGDCSNKNIKNVYASFTAATG